MGLPWFRMYAEAIDDEKLRLLAFEDRWHFVAILCLKTQGVLDESATLRQRCSNGDATDDATNMRNRKIAVKLGIAIRDLDEVQRRLMEVGLIDENWQPIAWEKRQFRSDDSTERSRLWRSRKSATLQQRRKNVAATSKQRRRNVNATPQDTDTDTDTDTDKRINTTGSATPGFVSFWTAWPNHKRKADRKGCLAKWQADGCEQKAQAICAAVLAWSKSEDWKKDGGQYVPAPRVWLNQRRYEAPPPGAPPPLEPFKPIVTDQYFNV